MPPTPYLTPGQKLKDALDALEAMVQQHCYSDAMTPDSYDDACLSANEEACEVLVRLRPERWEPTKLGIRRVRDGA